MIVQPSTHTTRLGLRFTLALALTLLACGEDALVGGNDGGGGEPHEEGDPGDREARCWLIEEFAAVPASDAGFARSPAVTIETARGTWGNSLGDTLQVEIPGAGKRRQYDCYDDPSIPTPAGPRPYVELELQAVLTLRTADSGWNERLDAKLTLYSYGLDSGESRISLAGSGSLPLEALHGTFVVPNDPQHPAADSVSIRASYEDDGWLVDRWVNQAREDGEACGCGDIGPAWQGEPLVLVRM
jgi:hypothetical protein